jgi:ribonuclease HI
MAEQIALTMNIDGAARGNPGPAAYGIYIVQPGKPPVEIKECLGNTTNNVAEYTALVTALHKAIDLGATEVLIRSDSELLVKQMNGEYRVKNANIQPLYQEAVALRNRLPKVRIVHVYREQNADADRLCNEALDGQAGNEKKAKPARPKKETPAPTAVADVWSHLQSEISDILKQADAIGEADNPERVAERVVRHLQQRGLRPPM